jgi:transposase
LSKKELQCSCGHELTQIGEDTSEELCHRPAKLWVREHVRLKYACKCCEETIKRAPAPFRVLPKCIASSGFLADMLVKKYSDHLPLYRQSQIWERESIEISRSTLSNWVIGCSKILDPLIILMKKEMLKSDYICSDETTVNVLQESKSTNYIWVHQSGERHNRVVIYEYNKSRSKEVVNEFLLNFRGYHQSDGYVGYEDFHSKAAITGVGCMAHARRKFMSLVKISKTRGVSDEIVDIMNDLYKIEKKFSGLSVEEIKSIRQSESLLLLNKLHEKLEYYKDKAPPKGFLSNAINYSLNQWQKLTAYIQDGRLRIDNNDSERAIKPFVIGRKNWMFYNSEGGAAASCVIYSIIETCKANNVNAFNYLKYVLENIHTAQNDEQLLALLPFNINREVLKENRRA